MDHTPDLGALFSRVTRRLIAAERPLLDARGLTMWEYVVLSELGRRDAPTQLALARRVGYDKTRLIALLDGLAERGLIDRTPDPGDRRAHVIRLTKAGSALLGAARTDIRRMEADLLGELTTEEQAALRTMLAALAGAGAPPA